MKKVKKNKNPNPCGACKVRKKACKTSCAFARHFPSSKAEKFRVFQEYCSFFSLTNIEDMLQGLDEKAAKDFMETILHHVEAGVKDAFNGCFGIQSQLGQDGEVVPVPQDQPEQARDEVQPARGVQNANPMPQDQHEQGRAEVQLPGERNPV